MHYGVKGMKWGVQKVSNVNYIKKGTVLKRIATSRDDPTYDNKKYLSINQEDHDKWDKYIGEGYLNRGKATFSISYKTVKDIKIMPSVEQGKMFTEMAIKDKTFANMVIKDLEEYNKRMGTKHTNDPGENISRLVSLQMESGKAFVNKVLKDTDYNALVDIHGTNVADNPIIVLDPDKNLKRYGEVEYSNAVKDYYMKNFNMKI